MYNEKWRDGLNEFLSPERTPGGCRVRSSLVIYNNTSCSNELLLYCMSNSVISQLDVLSLHGHILVSRYAT